MRPQEVNQMPTSNTTSLGWWYTIKSKLRAFLPATQQTKWMSKPPRSGSEWGQMDLTSSFRVDSRWVLDNWVVPDYASHIRLVVRSGWRPRAGEMRLNSFDSTGWTLNGVREAYPPPGSRWAFENLINRYPWRRFYLRLEYKRGTLVQVAKLAGEGRNE